MVWKSDLLPHAHQVIEHVNRPDIFVKTLAGLVRPPYWQQDGGMIGRAESPEAASALDGGGDRDGAAGSTRGGSTTGSGGLLILSTMNRTAEAFAVAIVGAEYLTGIVPRGTHEWHRFITPEELTLMAAHVR